MLAHLAQAQFPGLHPHQAEGCTIITPGGDRYLDLTSGFCPSGLTSVGYGRRLEAPTRADVQALYEALRPNLPPSLDALPLFPDDEAGITAVIRLAQGVTGRQQALFLRERGHARLPGSAAAFDLPDGDLAGLDWLPSDAELAETAVIVVEPVLGGGSCRPFPNAALAALRALADEAGALLAFDETGCGFGRSGHFFACQHTSVQPDLLLMGGAMASGRPLAAVAAPSRLAHEGAFNGWQPDEVTLATAIASAHLIGDELAANAAGRGRQLRVHLDEMQTRYPFFGQVRGRGLLQGVAVGVPARGPDPYLAARIQECVLEQGLLMAVGGADENVLLWRPPLTITADEIETAVAALEEAFDEVFED